MSPRRTDADRARRRELAHGRKPPCPFPNRAGSKCRSFALGTDGGCFTHTQDPAYLSRRRASAMKGSKVTKMDRAAKLLLAGPFGELTALIVRSMGEVYHGTLDPNRLNALAHAMRSIVAAADHDQAARVVERLERTIDAMAAGDETAAEVWVKPDGTFEVSDGEGGYQPVGGDALRLEGGDS